MLQWSSYRFFRMAMGLAQARHILHGSYLGIRCRILDSANLEHDRWRMIQSSYSLKLGGQEASRCGLGDHRKDHGKGRHDSEIGVTAQPRLQNRRRVGAEDDANIEIRQK